MTFIGKWIVLANVVASVAMLIFGMSVYTQRIDRFDRKPEGGELIKGQISQLQATLATLIEAKNRAEARWKLNDDELVALERERPERQQWYADTLTLVQQGKWRGQNVLNPLRQLTVDASGKITTDEPDARKVLVEIRPGTPLLSLSSYSELIADQATAIKMTKDEIKKAIDEQKELTSRIMDTDNVKGLRTLVREQIEIAERAANEWTYLQPFLTNRRAEAALIGKRRDSLEARLNELRLYYGASADR